jgi:prepilin-type N-terminal cleavage/methylation domain-containing protein
MLGLGEQKISNNKGVTIIELAVVMAIIAIMALFMSPALGEWASGFRVRGASKDIADALQLARLKSISDAVEYKVELDLDNQQFGVWKGNLRRNSTSWPNQEGSTINSPRGVTIDNIDGNTSGVHDIIFRPDGMTTASSTIAIHNEKGDSFQVTVSQTGRVSTEEGCGG